MNADVDDTNSTSKLRFGWFIPTIGDTSAFGDPGATMKPNLKLFTDIALAAEAAGFEYTLVPVQTMCYEAWVTCAMVAARTTRLKQLVAVRAGYMPPFQMAKMFTTFDRLSEGRVYANLIAGPGGEEQAAEGLFYAHDERYEVMDETVTLMKRLWTEDEPVTHKGKHFQIENGMVRPRPYQRPHPPFYIGGTSPAAKDVGAKHADVYLFWGDRPENIAKQIDEVRSIAAQYGREDQLKFGMRLQIVVRETEDEAWEAANAIIEGAPKLLTDAISNLWNESQANTRMKELGKVKDYMIDRHLWSGLTTIRTGAGVAVVGNPQQVADTLQEFIDIGCTEFCLSGYPHAREAERFGEMLMPFFKDRITSEPLIASSGVAAAV